MKLQIVHAGGVTQAIVDDDASPEEIRRIISIATTIEEGNGNGQIKVRPSAKRLDGGSSW